MSAADDMKPYLYMQIMGVHDAEGEMVLELAPPGRMSRRFVSIGAGITRVEVHETPDPPRPTYRNRRGPTPHDVEWQAEQDRIGDYLNEREREDRE